MSSGSISDSFLRGQWMGKGRKLVLTVLIMLGTSRMGGDMVLALKRILEGLSIRGSSKMDLSMVKVVKSGMRKWHIR